jgi:hypothetical protein
MYNAVGRGPCYHVASHENAAARDLYAEPGRHEVGQFCCLRGLFRREVPKPAHLVIEKLNVEIRGARVGIRTGAAQCQHRLMVGHQELIGCAFEIGDVFSLVTFNQFISGSGGRIAFHHHADSIFLPALGGKVGTSDASLLDLVRPPAVVGGRFGQPHVRRNSDVKILETALHRRRWN